MNFKAKLEASPETHHGCSQRCSRRIWSYADVIRPMFRAEMLGRRSTEAGAMRSMLSVMVAVAPRCCWNVKVRSRFKFPSRQCTCPV